MIFFPDERTPFWGTFLQILNTFFIISQNAHTVKFIKLSLLKKKLMEPQAQTGLSSL